ncbi:MAG TPA: L-glutamate gamma-semialdehyde dehydrogenase [Cyanobacteria bacterium UBA8530]|nr:L-glutamate gamma-semialdehyde dehydrogenase [Cyanobacteria bacterium UBA8530]
MQTEFKNEPFTDFSLIENKNAFLSALKKVESELGKHYPLVIGGERVSTEKKILSLNPAEPEQIVGMVSKADRELAERAIQTASEAFGKWKSVPAAARARCLFKAAAILRRRKHEFSAWLVFEAGKPWAEADGDTAEAIDFLEFYARQMLRLAGYQPLVRLQGEDNELTYIPLGVGLVIPPWNFPLAIMAGMTGAALVSGNTVVLKPASVTPVIAAKFLEVLEEAGVPDGVVNFLPGSGAEVGDYLVDHPLTRFVSFTGSKETGLRINERAAKTAPGQKWIKRVIAEMGGKDAIVVDESADLEAAAAAIVSSSFGFSGQKCSACSRAIIHEAVYDEVLELVRLKTNEISIGEPAKQETWMGPVIDEAAYKNVLKYIEIGKGEGRLINGGGKMERKGYFIQPTVIVDLDPKARIMQEEIFGPVVAVTKAESFDQALEIANDTDFGLTGAVYSNNREHLEKARQEFHVGNLYFNRKCTGALVGVHPFGGFNMSGTDSKAGGNDYLLQFTQGKLVSELM